MIPLHIAYDKTESALYESVSSMWGITPGLLSLLRQEDKSLKAYALEQLNIVVSVSWPQIAESLDLIFQLAQTRDFPARKQAALLAAKTTYCLGKKQESLDNALLAEEYFDITNTDEFTTKVMSYAIQQYMSIIHSGSTIPQAHTELVQRFIQFLLDQGSYSQVLCLSIETQLLQFTRLALEKDPGLSDQAIDMALSSVHDFKYKQSLLRLFVDFSVQTKDIFRLSQLYRYLQKPKSVAKLLSSLMLEDDEEKKLLSYQIAFEISENAHQQFRASVIENLHPNATDITNILQRKLLLNLYLQFLFDRNHCDLSILIALKEENRFDTSRSIVHTSVVLAYALMYAGTADDNFYRSNTSWFTNAKKWTQFTTAAAIGAIHLGHLSDALKILCSFLKTEAPEYVFGGALYALGLIYSNYNWEQKVIDIVISSLNEPRQEGESISPVIQHGACLALGLISMGSRKTDQYAQLRKVLLQDRPEPGETAGYAMGMVMLGLGQSEIVDDMRQLAENTEHEKIMRGIAMGLAFVMYGCEQKADPLIEILSKKQQPIFREGAAWVIALANVGNASNSALQRLLHIAVSDLNDNVRRAAVIGVGFVLSRHPKEVPAMIDLLARSYHPHVRSGACLALGISCAGTGMPEAIDIIKPLLKDPEDAVKQSAMIAMGMVLQQQSDKTTPYAKEFRSFIRSLINRKRNDMIIFGLCAATGILNAGGRNVVISCNSLTGENSVSATVGLALFCNHFFWHPLALMLSIAFHPTAIIGLDSNLKVVPWQFICRAPQSMFAYPPSFDLERDTVLVPKPANLSITGYRSESAPMSSENDEEESDNDEPFILMANMSRVTLSQLKYIELDKSSNYVPVTGHITHGFVMLKEIHNQ